MVKPVDTPVEGPRGTGRERLGVRVLRCVHLVSAQQNGETEPRSTQASRAWAERGIHGSVDAVC